MNVTFEPIRDAGRESRTAISLCLYRSNRLSVAKHLEPFWKFLIERPEQDLLIFAGDGLEEQVAKMINHSNIRVFNCGTSTNYSGHHWRYFGSMMGYDWTWFRGTDTPHVPEREQRIQKLAQDLNVESITFPSHSNDFYQCTGRTALSATGSASLAAWLKTTDPTNEQWHCDEMNLSTWHAQANLRTLIVLDRAPTFPPLASYLMERLQRGCHTHILKDRDDTPRKTAPIKVN